MSANELPSAEWCTVPGTGYSSTAGPGIDFPEHDESTPAETKKVTIVLPSCIILRL